MSLTFSRGLEDVIIKETSLTYIDGVNGILRYRGYNIEDLVNYSSFEEVIYLMLYGNLPNKSQLEEVREKLYRNFDVPKEVISMIYSLPKGSNAVGILESAFGMLASIYDPKWDKSTDRDLAISIISKAATITANIYRAKEGLKPKIVEPKKNFAESFLNTVFEKSFSNDEVKAMDAALILYVDHEVPASTTAGLVASSTLSDMYSCVVAALAALKGPLHGRAAEDAFNQFVEINSEDKVESWFEEKIIKGKNRLMGFGHRVYKTYDPRAKIFKYYSEKLSKNNSQANIYYKIASKLEEIGIKNFSDKKIYPNTDFYSGILFYSLGFPIYMFTALFALSRVLGWVAHFIEYVEEQHRLIRPRAIYVGPEKRDFRPLNER
jgi:citrate synthase